MKPIVPIPHWMARRISEKHDSLKEYGDNLGVMLVDDYWRQLNWETQVRVNDRLKRAWRRA
jgi:hypothetical protein